MKTTREINAMAHTARVQELAARDQQLLSGEDTTAAQMFAAGAEAALLWALGNIGAIPFPAVDLVRPSGNDDLDLTTLPGLPARHDQNA